MSFVSLVVLPLATSPSPSPSLSQSSPTSPLPGENDSTWLGPGFLGFLSLVFLAVALYFLYRGLTKQLRRVTFDEAAVNADVPEPAPRTVAAPSGAVSADVAAADTTTTDADGSDAQTSPGQQ